MKKFALGLVAVVSLAAVGCGLASVYCGNYPKDPNEWTREMRQSAPDKFAALAEQKVKTDMKTIDERLDAIRLAAGGLAKRYKDSYDKLEFGRKIGKEMVAAKQKGEFPVEILGVEYQEFQLENQMTLVGEELKVHANILKAVKKTSELLEKEKLELTLYRSKCKGQLDMLQAQVEIFKARKISLEGLALLDECADVLLDAGTYLAKLDPVADVETLMKRAESEAAEQQSATLDLEAVLAEMDEQMEETSGLEALLDGETKIDAKFESKDKEKGKLPTTLEEDEIPEEPAI